MTPPSTDSPTAPSLDASLYDDAPPNWRDELVIPDVSDLVTEDDTPVDNLLQEKLQRFLVQCLYSSLKCDTPFLAAADVGLFYAIAQSPLVPDVMLSLGVSMPQDWREKRKRSYFIWEFGKPPDVAIEIVSNKKGGELGDKLEKYAQAGVAYYVVFDPMTLLGEQRLQAYGLHEGCYSPLEETWLDNVQLGLTLWDGTFEDMKATWLRWCDRDGNLLLTGDERAEQESQRAEQERQRANRLAELLRSQGINPDDV